MNQPYDVIAVDDVHVSDLIYMYCLEPFIEEFSTEFEVIYKVDLGVYFEYGFLPLYRITDAMTEGEPVRTFEELQEFRGTQQCN